ncbi:MAG TPA: DUF922 domain-containing protein [Rubricoccaceae bacterium]|nr:DUF922 domain-containing protein [Rubricoccaceae bacterium]
MSPYLVVRFVLAVFVALQTGEGSTQPVRSSAAGGVSGALRTNVEQEFYPVQGRSEGDLLHSMLTRGPVWGERRFFGLTTTAVRYTYRRVPSRGGCTLSDVVVHLDVTVTLPRWTPPRGAPYALERDWAAFRTALERHEDGHRRLAVSFGEAIRSMLTLARTASCETMDAEVGRRVASLQSHFDRQQRDYDAATDHGASEGARWPRR